jgi:hypothetical protein
MSALCKGQLRLQWVYGYRGHQARNNVVVTSTGSIVYYVAAVGVVQTQKGGKPAQTFYGQHTDDILRFVYLSHPSSEVDSSCISVTSMMR